MKVRKRERKRERERESEREKERGRENLSETSEIDEGLRQLVGNNTLNTLLQFHIQLPTPCAPMPKSLLPNFLGFFI